MLVGIRPPPVTRLSRDAPAIPHLSALVPMRTAVAPRAELIDGGAKFV
jgi:hypothetical protein